VQVEGVLVQEKRLSYLYQVHKQVASAGPCRGVNPGYRGTYTSIGA
jgi:hypothetical protein